MEAGQVLLQMPVCLFSRGGWVACQAVARQVGSLRRRCATDEPGRSSTGSGCWCWGVRDYAAMWLRGGPAGPRGWDRSALVAVIAAAALGWGTTLGAPAVPPYSSEGSRVRCHRPGAQVGFRHRSCDCQLENGFDEALSALQGARLA